MRYYVTVGTRTFDVELGPGGATVDGTRVSAHLAHVEGTDLRSLLVDGASFRILAARDGDARWHLHLRGRRFAVEAVDERTHTIREMTGAGAVPSGPRPIRAPMPGLVVKIEVAPGDRVDAGQGVVIVEAMKMENELKAEGPAVVARIHVAPGQAVEKDQVLIDLEPVAEGEP
ncbi:MAG: acetyl-CoA carboxylase biotin carboxyl carrier protein subunit [Gemmatimonadota bacterium]